MNQEIAYNESPVDPFAAVFGQLATRIADDLSDRLESEMAERIRTAVADAMTAIDSQAPAGYVEPGPRSARKWFTVKELEQRWGDGFGKSKIYALTELELPYWEHGGSGRRYFWAYVWAFEKRISRKQADDLFHAHQEIEQERNALQARSAGNARLRKLPRT